MNHGLGIFGNILSLIPGIDAGNHINTIVGAAVGNQRVACIEVLSIQCGPGLGPRVAAVGTLGHN